MNRSAASLDPLWIVLFCGISNPKVLYGPIGCRQYYLSGTLGCESDLDGDLSRDTIAAILVPPFRPERLAR